MKTNGALEKKVLSDGEVDSEEETEASNDSLRDQGKSANALASLMGAYASDSDSETEETPGEAGLFFHFFFYRHSLVELPRWTWTKRYRGGFRFCWLSFESARRVV